MKYWIQHDDASLFSAVLQCSNTPVSADHYNTLPIGLKRTLDSGIGPQALKRLFDFFQFLYCYFAFIGFRIFFCQFLQDEPGIRLVT